MQLQFYKQMFFLNILLFDFVHKSQEDYFLSIMLVLL